MSLTSTAIDQEFDKLNAKIHTLLAWQFIQLLALGLIIGRVI